MPRCPTLLAGLLLLALSASLAACGGGSAPGDVLGDGARTSPFEQAPAPALWTEEGCVNCHGADGNGAGGGPSIRCTDYDRLDTHVRQATTSHAGGAFPALTDNALLDLVEFLRTADCLAGDPTNPPPTSGIPSTHTHSEDGVLHHPDYETNLTTCTTCHGANLEGSGSVPSCASCHGSEGFDDEDDDDEEDDESESGDE